MELVISKDFREICNKIIKMDKTEKEWAEIESDDMFHAESYVGGYDADENAFCFSYYDEKNKEYWFQLTLVQIKKITEYLLTSICIKEAEK